MNIPIVIKTLRELSVWLDCSKEHQEEIIKIINELELLLRGGIIYPMLPIYVKKNCKDLSGKHQPRIHDAPFRPNIHSCRHPAHPRIRIEVILQISVTLQILSSIIICRSDASLRCPCPFVLC